MVGCNEKRVLVALGRAFSVARIKRFPWCFLIIKMQIQFEYWGRASRHDRE